MPDLSTSIREAINMCGLEILQSERLIYALNDLHALRYRASRTIITALVQGGYTSQMYDMYIARANVDVDSLNTIITLVASSGYAVEHVRYVVLSLAKALGWYGGELTMADDTVDDLRTPVRMFVANGVSFNVCEVSGGRFSMGATIEQGIVAAFDERPAVEVSLDWFCIGQTLVTQELWQAVTGANPSHFVGAQLPVERVSWTESMDFVARVSEITGMPFRLPTEAEWEFAARGGLTAVQTMFAGADQADIDDYVWHKDNSNGTTHPVRSKKPNALGVYDMSGNVSEWCADWYYSSYTNGLAHINPQGPPTGMNRVIRGGSYNDKPINCRVAKRNSLNPNYRGRQIGLRLAL